MMESKNPHTGYGAGAGISFEPDVLSPTGNRPQLQANDAMKARMAWLMRLAPYFTEARHG